ncbi:MAG: hypothetical protein K1X78_04400 [Verrucomicrobiaceae bacterium]|nr:hypothetical protein [Verrucomicrobiaceae bacterium]
MNLLRPLPAHFRPPRNVSPTMPHAVLNSCAILPVRRPHAALLARAQSRVKRSRARGVGVALDY